MDGYFLRWYEWVLEQLVGLRVALFELFFVPERYSVGGLGG